MKRPTLFHVLFATAFSVVLICSALARQGTKMDPNAQTMTTPGLPRHQFNVYRWGFSHEPLG
jgi:hypothetical protein